jgi:hypothetical protein
MFVTAIQPRLTFANYTNSLILQSSILGVLLKSQLRPRLDHVATDKHASLQLKSVYCKTEVL